MSTVTPAPAAAPSKSVLLNRRRICKFAVGQKGTRALLHRIHRGQLLCLRARPAKDQEYVYYFFGKDHVGALNQFLRGTPKELRGVSAWIVLMELKTELDAIP